MTTANFVQYVGPRKEGAPIPDFVNEGFFEQNPFLAELSQTQRETFLSLATTAYLLNTIPWENAANPYKILEADAQAVRQLLYCWCLKTGFSDSKRALDALIDMIKWLRDFDWAVVHTHYRPKGKKPTGISFFTTLQIRCLVWDSEAQN